MEGEFRYRMNIFATLWAEGLVETVETLKNGFCDLAPRAWNKFGTAHWDLYSIVAMMRGVIEAIRAKNSWAAVREDGRVGGFGGGLEFGAVEILAEN